MNILLNSAIQRTYICEFPECVWNKVSPASVFQEKKGHTFT